MTAPALGNGRSGLHPDRRRRASNTRLDPNERLIQAQGRRAERWARRAQLRKITKRRRIRNCGTMLNAERGVTLAITGNTDGSRTAGFSGLASCGSVWACPRCAANIATRRADELATVMRAVEARGGSAFLLTLTMRHARDDRLGLTREERARLRELGENRAHYEDCNEQGWAFDEAAAEAEAIEENELRNRRGCWDVLSDAWGTVTSGAAWTKDQELFGGLLGWARVVEVTDGDNGWHVHVHALLCFAEQVSAELVAGSVGARMFARWRRALERRGFDATDDHGWDLRRVQLGDGDLADYFTKIAHEVTGSHRKEGKRPGGRTPMQLLADAVDTYEETALARWWEWEAVSEGRRQLTWSTGARDLRKLADLGKEATDEEIADEDIPADEHLPIPAETWDHIQAIGQAAVLLDAAERGGVNAAREWLADLSGWLSEINSRADCD